MFVTLVCIKTVDIWFDGEGGDIYDQRTTSLTIYPGVSTSSANRTTEKNSTTLDESGDIFRTNASVTISVDENNVIIEPNASNATVQYEGNYFIVFVIPSRPKNVAIRQAIRETWANVTAWPLLANQDEDKKKIKVMFIIGTLSKGSYSAELKEELSANNDLFVATNVTESYQTLRYKVLWGLTYSYQHYNFQYLVKTDDDVIVNLPVLIQALSNFKPGLHYTGRCINTRGPLPQRWVYCSGGGYVLSRDLVGHMLHLPDSVHNSTKEAEDVFIGWVVWNVNNFNNVYNTTQYSVRPRYRFFGLSLYRYKCGKVKMWFYHGYKQTDVEDRVEAFRNVFMNGTAIECRT